MKITIANKKLLSKPVTNLDKAKYFKNISFKTGNISKETFIKVIETGCTITYLYKDSEFNRDNSYMKNNYRGTQFICVDVDKCEISPIDFVERIKYKPTVVHTTFSNLTEQKGNKWCFHLIYCFDEVIEGEDNFRTVFDELTADYTEYVDNCAKDCHRVIFTSNKNLPNYIFKDYDIIYKVKDFVSDTIVEEYEDLDKQRSDDWGTFIAWSKNVIQSTRSQLADLGRLPAIPHIFSAVNSNSGYYNTSEIRVKPIENEPKVVASTESPQAISARYRAALIDSTEIDKDIETAESVHI